MSTLGLLPPHLELAAPFLLSWLIGASLLLGVATIVAGCARGAAPALRHTIWTAAISASLLIPPLLLMPIPRLETSLASLVLALPGLGGSSDLGGGDAALPLGNAPATPAGSWSVSTGTSARPESGYTPPAAAAMRLVVILWLTGSALGIGWLAIAQWRSHRLVARSLPPAEPRFLAQYHSARQTLGISDAVDLRIAPSLRVPGTVGVFQPTVLIPRGFEHWSAEQRTAVLLHELAHVRRRDCATQLLAHLACALLWPTPLVWRAARMSRLEQEQACDDIVVESGIESTRYASLLLEVVRRARSAGTLPLPVLAMARHSQLESRMRAVLRETDTRRTSGLARVTATALFVILTVPVVAATAPAAPAVELQVAPPDLAAGVVIRPRSNLPTENTIERRLHAEPSGRDVSVPGIARDSVHHEFQVDKPATAVPGTMTPEYPAALRAAGVEGEVRLQFVVDTLGIVEPASVRVLASTNDLFAATSRAAVIQMRFSPAELRSRRVRQFVELPITFRLDRGSQLPPSGAKVAAPGDSLGHDRRRLTGELFMRFHRERINEHGLQATINDSTVYAWFVQPEWRSEVLHAGVAPMPPTAGAWTPEYVRREIAARHPSLDVKGVWVYNVPLGGEGLRANIALITVPAETAAP